METPAGWLLVLALGGYLMVTCDVEAAVVRYSLATKPLNEIAKSQFPFYVSLGRDMCAGALVNSRAIFTTAYCLEGHDPFFNEIRAGYNNRTYAITAMSSQSCASDSYVDNGSKGYINNYGLFFLDKPFNESALVKPLELKNDGGKSWILDADCTAIGPGQLNATDGYVTHNKVKFVACPLDKHESVLCFRSVKKPDATTCQNDQGGPIICQKDGKPRLVALTSSYIEQGCRPSDIETIHEATSALYFYEHLYNRCVEFFSKRSD